MTAPHDTRHHRMRRGLVVLTLTAAAVVTVAYLRDPPWLLQYSSGLREWETAGDGSRVRRAGAHASFFVPSGARDLRLRVRTTFEGPTDWPMTVSVTLDDVPVDRLVLSDGAWRESVIRLPPRGSRRVRRVDIRSDRTRDDNRAIQLHIP